MVDISQEVRTEKEALANLEEQQRRSNYKLECYSLLQQRLRKQHKMIFDIKNILENMRNQKKKEEALKEKHTNLEQEYITLTLENQVTSIDDELITSRFQDCTEKY
jgi:acyl carrier protein phosphodiesterase